MTDKKLVELYWERREEALERTQEQYGAWCRTIARNILDQEQDVEECLSDSLLSLWNAIPPARPLHFQGLSRHLRRCLFLRGRVMLVFFCHDDSS